MVAKTFSIILFSLLCTSIFAQKTSKTKAEVSTNNPDFLQKNLPASWQFKAVKDSFWLPAKVPGSVHTDLIANGIIPDPFYRTNEHNLQWIDKKDWEYKTTFNIEAALLKKENIALNFKGLDTYASVYLNDVLLLKTDNMFVAWETDCKSLLKLGENTMRIVFESPINIGLKKREKLGYWLPNAVNDQSELGGLGKKQVSIFSRKAGYHFGWDWGPRLVTSGIWQDIELRAWNSASLKDVYYKQTKVTNQSADIQTEIEILASHDFEAQVQIFVDSVVSIQKKIQLKKGNNKVEIPLTIEQPNLWWTNGLGTQKLYNIDLKFLEAGKVVAETSKKIGLKTLKVIQKKDDVGETFYFELNGHPVFMKGANYIPQDVFLDRVSPEHYEKMIQNAVEANFNMLRVWGGGIYEKDLFYDLCDAYGILVWQDFMFACAMYPGDSAFLENVKKEAEFNVKRLRNHTSIALWCGNNENLIAWHNWGWKDSILKGQGQSIVDKIWKGYVDVYHKILPEIVNVLDSDTFYWSSSPTSATGKLENLQSGDSHYWKVWGQKAAFSTYNDHIPRFMSEYGFQSFPEFSSVKKYTIEEDWSIYSTVMKSHQRSTIGNENVEYYMKSMYKTPKNFETFLYVSQLLQAEGMKTAIEAHRRNMPYCMGSLYWQINDCWPVASWSSIDYYGNWKASHYKVKELYKPIKTLFFEKNNQLEVHVVSDELQNKKGILNLKLIDFNGKVLISSQDSINIKANTSAIYNQLGLKNILRNFDKSKVFLVAELQNEAGELFDESHYFLSTPNQLNFNKPKIQTTVFKNDAGQIILEVRSDVLAKDVRFTTSFEGRFSDNYFDLLPNKTYQIQFKSSEEMDLEALKESLQVLSLVDTY